MGQSDLSDPPTVLIVDDDGLVLARLKELVVETGYAVQTTTSGPGALGSLETSSASIVITDLKMPGMDGLDLCRRIRQRTWSRYLYIILLTVQDEEKHIQAGLVAGADDYISKRANSTQFKARLRAAKRFLALERSAENERSKKRQMTTAEVLTGVYDRAYLVRNLALELRRSSTGSSDVSLLLFEFEHLNRIHTTYGHSIADTVLTRLTKQIFKRLNSSTAWCAHLGGEEFAVVLEDTQLADAESCAEEVRRAIADGSINASVGIVHVKLRIGVSGLMEGGEGTKACVESLLARASKDLYTRKTAGRHRIGVPHFEQPGSNLVMGEAMPRSRHNQSSERLGATSSISLQ